MRPRGRGVSCALPCPRGRSAGSTPERSAALSARRRGTALLQFTKEELSQIEAIAMDMWEPYILAAQACVPEAAKKIVFDRFHATRQVTSAGDKVRRGAHKALAERGDPRLMGTKYLE